MGKPGARDIYLYEKPEKEQTFVVHVYLLDRKREAWVCLWRYFGGQKKERRTYSLSLCILSRKLRYWGWRLPTREGTRTTIIYAHGGSEIEQISTHFCRLLRQGKEEEHLLPEPLLWAECYDIQRLTRRPDARSAAQYIRFEAEESGTNMCVNCESLEIEKVRPMASLAMGFEDQKRERSPWGLPPFLLDKDLRYMEVLEKARHSQRSATIYIIMV
jgi:hypothetical protein